MFSKEVVDPLVVGIDRDTDRLAWTPRSVEEIQWEEASCVMPNSESLLERRGKSMEVSLDISDGG